MMSTENTTEQYIQFIERLKREDHRSSALNDLKNLITYKPASETTTTMRRVGISKIVQCLNVNVNGIRDTHSAEILTVCLLRLMKYSPLTDRQLRLINRVPLVTHQVLETVKTGQVADVDLTCDLLKICFEKFETGDVVKIYTSHIMYLLRHEKSCVRRLAIDEVNKTLSASPDILPIAEYIDVFVATGQMVCDPDVGVANVAISITSNLPQEAYRKVLDEMKIALEYNSSSKCNAYEVIVNISVKSFELFNLSIEMGYIDSMVSELQSSDVLYQLNILELLSRLAVKPYGITHLVRQGALNRIADYIGDLKTNPLGGLLIPGYMKFFGCIAHHYPKEIIEKYPVLLECLFDAIDCGEPATLPVALDTLGFVATTIEGKLSLAAIGSRYIQMVQKVGEIIKNSPTEIKVRALYCFASLISVENDPNIPKTGPVDHRVTLMTREWFRSLSTTPSAMDILFNNCKSPFPDIKLAAFSVLDALCQHQWGQELVARTAGCIEYLLDRSLDHMKESKEAKYNIIKRLSRSAAFDASNLMKLQTYVEQGPFYSETDLQVAMDDGEN